ncbi:peptidoglycan DD-metalloendopeptidase family protein [Desulfitobacterium sp. Sab5]|uniref:peptidoglycan DD-metalloendopeptidase family protein n=1 Tax=Desulfitobacterium nosdiversum TaxID=3375356 RepID=UPI003CF038D1
MNKLKGWQRGWAYFMMLAIIGLASLTYGLARLEQVPSGREVVGQAIAAKDQQTVTGAVSETSDSDKSIIRQEETNKADADKQEQKAKLSVKDFPSPATGEHIREVGNYYSENLDTYLFHAGTDYALPEGAVIRATHEGKVTFAGADPILGEKVEIDCGENWRVVYGGLENLRVRQGDVIEQNEVLGQIGYYPGADGVNDRTQLHYEVWNGDKAQVQ